MVRHAAGDGPRAHGSFVRSVLHVPARSVTRPSEPSAAARGGRARAPVAQDGQRQASPLANDPATALA